MQKAALKEKVGNLWLDSLSNPDRAKIGPHLDHLDFQPGDTLFEPGDDVDRIYFPTEGVISIMTVLPTGQAVETAAIGREGLVGAACGPMNGLSVSRAVAQTGGAAASISTDHFSAALTESESLRDALARHTEALLLQVQQTAACNVLHKLEARFARWLLTVQDRTHGETLPLTQAQLAEMLGVRRATLAEAAAAMELQGLIRRGRGRVGVLDRKRLEEAACDCYGVVKQISADLLRGAVD